MDKIETRGGSRPGGGSSDGRIQAGAPEGKMHKTVHAGRALDEKEEINRKAKIY